MKPILSAATAAVVTMIFGSNIAQATEYEKRFAVVSQLNFENYCTKAHGVAYVPVLKGRYENWRCKRLLKIKNNKEGGAFAEPINYNHACWLQHGKGYKAHAMEPDYPAAWQCGTYYWARKSAPQDAPSPAPPQNGSPAGSGPIDVGGLDLTGYCRKMYDNSYKAVVTGDSPNSWRCRSSTTLGDWNINFTDVCRRQYGDISLTAKWAGSQGWRCYKPATSDTGTGGRPRVRDHGDGQ